MIGPSSRRGFLRGLTTLPLIGGGVALIGSPSAVAEPCTPMLLNAYVGFLAREYAHAHDELIAIARAGDINTAWRQPIAGLYFANMPPSPHADMLVKSALPSTRAALVLSTVGCEWRR